MTKLNLREGHLAALVFIVGVAGVVALMWYSV